MKEFGKKLSFDWRNLAQWKIRVHVDAAQFVVKMVVSILFLVFFVGGQWVALAVWLTLMLVDVRTDKDKSANGEKEDHEPK